ncbi:hypothetical protein SS1G_02249 [Sclerotinia sclerotiorum 1980 UF-70]|uniref:TLC domain-containing protein n=2 Tax=Sclerotinia sclerotiorum (strain ATCC 18683 / 1980 / Ss-1) TaxID=665079 RepID=A0A1D9Q1W7_SCLS1|nr:hypothetical protein SS1G_02249 [Sclerotinia sclerotiorum 1980 UF-70]APA08543.1 hypothetical protein sscle_04g033130 [Sclerotinia sclerotiorum 1980 UF-70]EDN99395.1 hypothetical protein SS1G_02249 [Sclerotinia sclerotiorum 1980 UF-70]
MTNPYSNSPHITKVPLETISKLAPFSGLILSIILILYFLIRYYLLEPIMLPRLYKSTFTSMPLGSPLRLGFINHHIAGLTKLLILLLAAYPFISVTFLTASLHTPFAKGSQVTMGDILIVAAQMLIAMYIFELLYRPKISPVSVGHHVGTILIGQSAIAISLDLVKERDATIEFILCTVWGAFDIISEFLPHLTIILYRVYPTSHAFLRKIFRIAAITTFTGTVAETILTMFLFGSLWDRWTLAFKITTPMLHIVFMAAQLWGTWNFVGLYRRQGVLMGEMEKRGGEAGLEMAIGMGMGEERGSVSEVEGEREMEYGGIGRRVTATRVGSGE